jgi:hypothetical protein
MDYRLDDQGLIPGRGKKIFSSLNLSDQLWSPPSLLSDVYWGLFRWGKVTEA